MRPMSLQLFSLFPQFDPSSLSQTAADIFVQTHLSCSFFKMAASHRRCSLPIIRPQVQSICER